jgi:hypothetical protein
LRYFIEIKNKETVRSVSLILVILGNLGHSSHLFICYLSLLLLAAEDKNKFDIQRGV